MPNAAVKEMTNRFLCWKLPQDFHPDAGISFVPTHFQKGENADLHWPVGTNLLTANQAQAMFEHCAPGCTWTLDDDEHGIWQSACGVTWSFTDGGPEDNDCHFCHKCGGALNIVRPEPESDDSDDVV